MRALAAGFLLALCGCASSSTHSSVADPDSNSLSKAQFAHDEVIAYDIVDAAGSIVGRTRTVYRVNGEGKVKVRTRIQYIDNTKEFAWVFSSKGRVTFFKRLCSKDGLKSLQWKSGKLLVSDGTSQTEHTTVDEFRLPMTSETPFALNLLVRSLELRAGSSVASRYFDPERLRQVPLQLTVYTDAQGDLQVSSSIGTAAFDTQGRLIRLKATDGRSFVRSGNKKPIAAVTLVKKLAYRPPEMPAWKDEPIRVLSRAGVLSVPRNLARWPRLKAPVVFLFSDTEQQDRYGISNEIDYGTWQIQDHLLEAGYAVLRLDDHAAEEGKHDVSAILQFLASQSSIDAENIILLGHGSGIQPAFEGAVQFPELVKGVGILAGDWQSLSTSLREKLKGLPTSVAIFQGLKDIEVSWKTDTKALVDLLKSRPGGAQKTMAKYYSRVDHLMKSESKKSSRARYKDASRRVERDFLADLLGWLDSNPELKQ